MTNGTETIQSLLDLFQAEVQTHTTTIQGGLQTLEQSPEALENFDALIRAAHAIEGGAKIVEFEAAIKIAHALKSGLTALQTGEVRPQPEHLNVLQQGSTMLQRLAAAVENDPNAWLAEHQQEVSQLADALTNIVSARPVSRQAQAAAPEQQPVGPATAAPAAEEPSSDRRKTPPPPETPSEPRTEPTPPPPPKASSPKPTTSSEPQPITNLSGGITDEAMLDLFRNEVENHTATLTDGLLALEEHPGASDRLDSLMRAAHSIKGGARVVELDAAVQLAHVMEDCFVTAQKGQIRFHSDQIDILFQGVDMLSRIAGIAGPDAAAWLEAHRDEIERLFLSMSAILRGETPAGAPTAAPEPAAEPAEAPPPPTEPPSPPQQPSAQQPPTDPVSSQPAPAAAVQTEEDKAAASQAEEKDRMVRVTATKIERLIGLGGEVVVSSSWLPPFSDSFMALKKSHNELFAVLEKLQETAHEEQPTKALVLQAREKIKESSQLLADRMNQLDMFTSTSANLSDRLYHEVISVRMRPFADGIQSFPRMVRDIAKQLGKKVKLEIVGKATEVDRDILEKLDAPLTHLIRNAIDHGLERPEERRAVGKPETGTVRLEAVHRAGMLMITVADDGRGIDLAKLRQKIIEKGLAEATMVENLTEAEILEFLFLPGFSTSRNVTEISGRGVGLDVVHEMVHEVGGVVRAATRAGEGLSFHMELPLTLSVIRTFLVEIAGEPYAFPLARIDHCLELSQQDLEVVEDRQYFRFDDSNNIALVDIHDVLEIDEPNSHTNGLPIVIISDRSNAYGLLVDKFIGEYDLVVRPLDSRLGKVPDISAVAVMLDGSPVLIFDVEDMLRSVDKMMNKQRFRYVQEAVPEKKPKASQKRILVVDDSITVRETERKILENLGYRVDVAVDGMDGWNAVRSENFDLVISDIDMPRMNGIQLVTHIKQHDLLKALPVVIISYKDTEEHRLQGLQAGANYYLTKSSFQDDSFINAVVDLIGEP
jgi:two-component system, chemotaxis family, sensor histidine kinase and response regulator WspE